MLRLFCIGFTKRRPNQVKRTCYAQASQIRQVTTLEICVVPIKRLETLLASLQSQYVDIICVCRSAARWQKSWVTKLQLVILKNWCRSSSLRSLGRRLRRQHQTSFLYRMSSSARWKFWRHPSSTLGSSWRYCSRQSFCLFMYSKGILVSVPCELMPYVISRCMVTTPRRMLVSRWKGLLKVTRRWEDLRRLLQPSD